MIASDGCPRLSRENSREDREWAEAAASRLSGVAAVEAECAGEALGSGGSGGGGVDEIMGKTEAEVATLVKRLSNASMPASSAGADSSPQPGSATAPPPARRPAPLEQPAAPLDGDATSKRKAPATPSTPAGVDAFFGDLLNSPKGDLSKSSSKILDNWAL